MMVHLVNAAVASRAVVSPRRFDAVTALAQSPRWFEMFKGAFVFVWGRVLLNATGVSGGGLEVGCTEQAKDHVGGDKVQEVRPMSHEEREHRDMHCVSDE
jgi:hypothetical protein